MRASRDYETSLTRTKIDFLTLPLLIGIFQAALTYLLRLSVNLFTS